MASLREIAEKGGECGEAGGAAGAEGGWGIYVVAGGGKDTGG